MGLRWCRKEYWRQGGQRVEIPWLRKPSVRYILTVSRLEVSVDDFMPSWNRLFIRRSTRAVTDCCCNTVKNVPEKRLGKY